MGGVSAQLSIMSKPNGPGGRQGHHVGMLAKGQRLPAHEWWMLREEHGVRSPHNGRTETFRTSHSSCSIYKKLTGCCCDPTLLGRSFVTSCHTLQTHPGIVYCSFMKCPQLRQWTTDLKRITRLSCWTVEKRVPPLMMRRDTARSPLYGATNISPVTHPGLGRCEL